MNEGNDDLRRVSREAWREHRRQRFRRRGRRAYIRSVYFLPSMATLGNAVCGFAAMYVATLTLESKDPWTQFFARHHFTFAAYLGAVMGPATNRWTGGAFALIAIFLPSFLLVVGALPFWDALRARAQFQAALRGINAGVVGLLLAALYHPVWTSAIHASSDFALALATFGLLSLWRVPPWLVVALAAIGGWALAGFR